MVSLTAAAVARTLPDHRSNSVGIPIMRLPPDCHDEGWLPVSDGNCRARVPHFPMGRKQSQQIIDLFL